MSDKLNGGGPAFPINELYTDGKYRTSTPGMTLRDWFAGQALAGIIQIPLERLSRHQLTYQDAVRDAYTYADAMLAARKAAP